ncbi:MAG: hypothetical protein D6746_02180 [Bacteroidetes bacterium]|nr:MAG: hypothetical protein D6746_02180 [Bacteroidota bacterium]
MERDTTRERSPEPVFRTGAGRRAALDPDVNPRGSFMNKALRTFLAGRIRTGLVLGLLVMLAACDGAEPEPPETATGPGSLIEATRIETVTRDEIDDMGFPVVASFDVEIYRVRYRTVDPAGNETEASGALMRPRGVVPALPLVSYQHGTIVRKADVASIQGTGAAEALVGVLFATTGYLAVMPDYLGLGTSEGLHPYVHAASLATAVVDMLRAGRHFAEQEGLRLDGRVFLIGYSEGGYATAAAQRLIEATYPDEFDLAASAPMAGNYDMSGTMAELMLRPEPYPAPFFLPYTLLAYDLVYDLWDDPSEVFVAPYDTRLPVLFDGTRSSAEIDAELPAVPIEMLQPAYVEAFRNDTSHPLWQALRDNDLLDWTPQAPTRLYHCTGDDLVPYANTEVAVARFRARGATSVEAVPLDFGTHAACAAPALLLAKTWFDSFRSAKRAPAGGRAAYALSSTR